MTDLKKHFLLDPDVIFLNHGSFGATPRAVFDVYREWQRKLEHQPVKFLGRDLRGYLKQARQSLGRFLHADADDIVFIPNATFGVNVIARSLALGHGDEVLTTNHEYGACNNVWDFMCAKTGASYIRVPIELPVSSSEEIVEQLWRGVTPQTRIIFLSHITSATALRLPVKEICQRARLEGILTLIDGAHAPGQIPLNLEEIDADFYTGNAHKWMMSPKGAAFLYTRRDKQDLVEPLVLSWGWGAEPEYSTGSTYVDYLEQQGTTDPSVYLSVPAAIQFQTEHDWPKVRQSCHELAREALRRTLDLTGLESPYADDEDFYCQMAILPLPPIADMLAFKTRLYREYRIEIPGIEWEGHQFVRVSIQGYNSPADVDVLLHALAELLPQMQT